MFRLVVTSFIGLLFLIFVSPAFAAEGAEAAGTSGLNAIAAALAIAIAAFGGTMAQAKTAAAALESIGRNPGAAGQMFVPMILGLAFIESLVIFALIIAFILS
jgi:F-type H+-transporting ATPase subunit c